MTKTQRARRLDDVEEQLSDAAESGGEEWSVEWRDANPAERPEGMAVDGDSRTIYYDVWEAQGEVLAALDGGDRDVVAGLMGYGAGKTITGARWLIDQALTHAGSSFLCMGINYSRARDSTYSTLFSQLPGSSKTAVITSDYNGPEEASPVVRDYNRSSHVLTLTNDTTIVLGSADTWSRHAGSEFGGIWCDEPSHYQVDLHQLLEMLGSRLRGVEGPKVQFWSLTGNGFNDAHTILEKRETADGDELPHDIELIRADTRNNPFLSDGEIESFERQYGDTERESQALEGGFSAATGLVYTDFSRDTHVVDAVDAVDMVDESNEFRLYGFDQGWNDPLAMLEVGKTDYGQLIVLSEFYQSERHTEDAINYLKGRPKGTIFAEHEPADIRKFRQAGWPAVKAEKSIDAGISEVRKRLETDESGRPGLLVSSACQNLIRELLGYQEDQVGTSAAEDHACDGLRYLIMGAEQVEAREQQRSGGSFVRSFGGSTSNTGGLVDSRRGGGLF
jgi:phage terminase large subunit